MMENKRAIPVPGEFYRHFKNRLYQIRAIAKNSETGELMVVYQALYGSFEVWVRPLSMFMEEVDRVKYPDAAQQYRFERVILSDSVEPTWPILNDSQFDGQVQERQLNPHLMEFFEAMDDKRYDQMLEALAKLSRDVTPKEIDDISMVLDLRPVGESPMEQIADIRRHILMLKKFDGDRLR